MTLVAFLVGVLVGAIGILVAAFLTGRREIRRRHLNPSERLDRLHVVAFSTKRTQVKTKSIH